MQSFNISLDENINELTNTILENNINIDKLTIENNKQRDLLDIRDNMIKNMSNEIYLNKLSTESAIKE